MPSLSLYAVAQAVVLSGIVLLVSAPFGGFGIARALANDTLFSTYEWDAWFYLVAVLGLPFPIGLVSGRLVQTLVRPGGAQAPLRVKQSPAIQILLKLRRKIQDSSVPDWIYWLVGEGAPTAWDRVWTDIGEQGKEVLVQVDLTDDGQVVGVFASDSFVVTSPQQHGLFLQREYAEDGAKLVEVESSKGVFIDGSQIKSLRFYRHQPLEEQLWEEGLDPGVGEPGAGGREPEAGEEAQVDPPS